MTRVLFRAIAVLAVSTGVGVLGYLARNTRAALPAGQAKHGLTGSYYVGNFDFMSDVPPAPGSPYYSQVWFSKNDFELPRAFTGPAATHVDPQVAFGQGKGFNVKDSNLPLMTWWPTSFAVPAGRDVRSVHFVAATWKGYIHLPKPGTYYFATVSWFGPSAVYLNQARVALNGIGGVQVADLFSYAKEDVQDFVQKFRSGREDLALSPNSRDQYVVPVSIDAPRDVPIEVQYQCWRGCFGIDLFWVTPGAPRDANGKPIAKIVPADALYTEPPGTIEKLTVRSANSTIEADHLYFPTEYAEGAVNLTIRLADKDGNPVAGKHVHVTSLTSYGGADGIVQPDKPTDEKGETTAKIRTGEGFKVAHDSTIFATNLTDLVDAAQVAHVSFQQVDWNFFDTFAPYYDQRFLIIPNPPVVGRPTLIKTALKNHSKFPATVTVTFLTTDANIGFTNWAEIAKVKDLTLQPGESKEVSTTFTPKEVSSHKCFGVEVRARYIAMNPSDGKVLAAALVPLIMPQTNAPAATTSGLCEGVTIGECIGRTINKYVVAPPPCGTAQFDPRRGDLMQRVPVHPDYPFGHCIRAPSEKTYCESALDQIRQQIAIDTANMKTALSNYDWESAQGLLDLIQQLEKLAAALEKCANEPPEPAYRRLAAAGSDTPAAYLGAVTASMERYGGAEVQGDRDWMARQFTAQRLYLKRYGETLRSAADELQKRAESLPPDDASKLSAIQAAQNKFVEQWRRGERFSPEQLNWMKKTGVSEENATKAIETFMANKEIPPAKSTRTMLLESAALYRQSADEAERVVNAPVNNAEQGKSGQPLTQTYVVGNPHDKQENVDLFVRPISIPPDWKLSVINAEQAETQGQKAPDPKLPQYPVREVEAGKHYAVTLPAKAQVKVASVLVPVGEVGARTTARWAVEGKISNELIGGMVHEMNVPYIIADLQLPPVGSKEVEEELPVPARPWVRLVAEVAVGIIIFGLLVYFFLFWRSRRRTDASSAP